MVAIGPAHETWLRFARLMSDWDPGRVKTRTFMAGPVRPVLGADRFRVERHFGIDVLERFALEVRRSRPRLDRAKQFYICSRWFGTLRVTWRAGNSTKISLLDFFALADLAWRTFHHHPALGQDISVIGDGERLMHILLHKKDRNATLVDLADDVEVLLDEKRRQAE